MKKSNRKNFLQFVVLVLFLAALFVPQDANRLLIAGIALIGIGVTLFSYLLPLFTERLKNREHKLRKRPERTRHLEGTPDLETILWRQIKFQITGKLKEAFPDATWDFVKEPPLSQMQYTSCSHTLKDPDKTRNSAADNRVSLYKMLPN